MMSIAKAALEKQLSTLRDRFVRGLADRFNAIEDALHQEDAAGDVERLFHSLAGTAATYRLEEIASLAREGEDLCGNAFDGSRLMAIVESLRRVAADESVHRADDALYEAKESGRARVGFAA